jgi:hypothetical protein
MNGLAMEVSTAMCLMSAVGNLCKEIPYEHIWVPLVACPPVRTLDEPSTHAITHRAGALVDKATSGTRQGQEEARPQPRAVFQGRCPWLLQAALSGLRKRLAIVLQGRCPWLLQAAPSGLRKGESTNKPRPEPSLSLSVRKCPLLKTILRRNLPAK